MEQRVSLITLGVADLERSRRFYEDLGWKRGNRDDGVVFFQLPGSVLALWGREELAIETGLPDSGGFGGVALAYNTRSRAEVDAVLLEAVRAGGFTLAQRTRLAAEAFVHTATYDVAVASWMGNVATTTDEVDGEHTGFPAWIGATWDRAAVLRYGENPHQRAALYSDGYGPAGLRRRASCTARR